MPVTVQTEATSGRTLTSADWDSIIPFVGSGVGTFSLPKSAFQGQAGKTIRIVPDGTRVALQTETSASVRVLSGTREFEDLDGTYTNIVMDTITPTVPVGTKLTFYAVGSMRVESVQNLENVVVECDGVDYYSLLTLPAGTGIYRFFWAVAIPLGSPVASSVKTFKVKVENKELVNSQPSDGAWQWAIHSYTDQENPVDELIAQHLAGQPLATSVVMSADIGFAGVSLYAIGLRNGGLVSGQQATGASTVQVLSGEVGPAGKLSGYLLSRIDASTTGIQQTTFNFGGTAAKLGYAGISPRLDNSGYKVITTASQLVSSVDNGSIVITVINNDKIEVLVN